MSQEVAIAKLWVQILSYYPRGKRIIGLFSKNCTKFENPYMEPIMYTSLSSTLVHAWKTFELWRGIFNHFLTYSYSTQEGQYWYSGVYIFTFRICLFTFNNLKQFWEKFSQRNEMFHGSSKKNWHTFGISRLKNWLRILYPKLHHFPPTEKPYIHIFRWTSSYLQMTLMSLPSLLPRPSSKIPSPNRLSLVTSSNTGHIFGRPHCSTHPHSSQHPNGLHSQYPSFGSRVTSAYRNMTLLTRLLRNSCCSPLSPIYH